MQGKFKCVVCNKMFDDRSLVIEIQDSIIESKGKVKRNDFVCYSCSQTLYPGMQPPRSTKVQCPKCGEVIEVWF